MFNYRCLVSVAGEDRSQLVESTRSWLLGNLVRPHQLSHRQQGLLQSEDLSPQQTGVLDAIPDRLLSLRHHARDSSHPGNSLGDCAIGHMCDRTTSAATPGENVRLALLPSIF